ncbi:MAG: hypothetical protein ACP5LD_10495 [Desulfomonilaceae bacterium]
MIDVGGESTKSFAIEIGGKKERDVEVESVVRSIDDVEKEVNSLSVVDEASYARASEILVQVARLKKRLEERRNFFVKPLNDQVKRINNLFKSLQEPLDRMDKKLRDAIAAYRWQMEQKRKEEEEFLRKKREILARLAEKKGETVAPPPPVEPMPIPAAVRTEDGLVTTRKVWTFRVINELLIPREYLVLDESKVRKAIAAGVREIPGLEIYQHEEVVVR